MQDTGRERRRARPLAPVLIALTTGGAVACIGALATATVAVRTGWLDGWTTWPLGLAVGIAVAVSTRGRGDHRVRWLAAALAVAATAASVYLTEHTLLIQLRRIDGLPVQGLLDHQTLRAAVSRFVHDPSVAVPWLLGTASAWRTAAAGVRPAGPPRAGHATEPGRA